MVVCDSLGWEWVEYLLPWWQIISSHCILLTNHGNVLWTCEYKDVCNCLCMLCWSTTKGNLSDCCAVKTVEVGYICFGWLHFWVMCSFWRSACVCVCPLSVDLLFVFWGDWILDNGIKCIQMAYIYTFISYVTHNSISFYSNSARVYVCQKKKEMTLKEVVWECVNLWTCAPHKLFV